LEEIIMTDNPYLRDFFKWASDTKYGPIITGSVAVDPKVYREAVEEFHKYLSEHNDHENDHEWNYGQYD